MNSKWQYDEMKQSGVDYTDLSEVEAYDARMQKLRNVQKEAEEIINCVGLTGSHVLLEFGAGTGDLAVAAAKKCLKVIAVDVSPTMLAYAEHKAKNRGVNNIEYCHAGFLTYEHYGEPLDVVVSQLALHHLPDFWKLVALKRIHSMLKKGGRFYLRDTVYSFDMDGYGEFFKDWINGIKLAAGEELARDTEMSISDEFSTCDWIMEGLIKRAGFKIERVDYYRGFLAVFLCKKP